MISEGKPRNSDGNMFQCYFVQHVPSFKSPWIETVSPRREASIQPLDLCTIIRESVSITIA
jgi:hypothetical protein